ncbi:MAG: hypothetical protein ACC662_09950, partial [Planctomycetota bacterium]
MRPRHVAALFVPALLAAWLSVRAAADGEAVGKKKPSPLAIATRAVPTGVVGKAYEARFAVRGGTGAPATWRLASGRLPEGLRLEGGPTATGWGAFERLGRIEASDGEGGLGEISGLAASRTNPGILWAHDDGGNPAQ